MLPDWFDKIIAGGPAAIFAIMWWLERLERREEREEHKTVSKDMLKAMLKTENTLETIGHIFNSKAK